MTITLSSVAHTAIDQMFTGLDTILKKGAADAQARGIDEAVYLNTRMAPDMFALKRQIQVATEMPARMLSRLSDESLPSFADDEETFAALRERITKARTFIKGLSEDAMNANPDDSITFPTGRDKVTTLPRRSFLQNMILPNVYFHVTMTYAILRHLGVDIGKMDFLAAPQE